MLMRRQVAQSRPGSARSARQSFQPTARPSLLSSALSCLHRLRGWGSSSIAVARGDEVPAILPPRADDLSAPSQDSGSDAAPSTSSSSYPHQQQAATILQRPSWEAFAARAGRALCVCLAVLALQHLLIPAAQAAAAASSSGSGNALSGIVSFILHLDKHLSAMIEQHGRTTYAILWAIVFAETGLVLTPFLPGDSLLFAAGAFAGMGKLDVGILMLVFLTSAILGDAVNYAVGQKLGGWALEKNIVKREYIDKTEEFYARYGGKTVVLARFVPIIRTFAPFVAGVGSMPYARFATYNVVGAIIWSVLFVGAGFFFGNLPFVQKNFTLVVLAIVAVSVVPVVIEIINARRSGEKPIAE